MSITRQAAVCEPLARRVTPSVGWDLIPVPRRLVSADSAPLRLYALLYELGADHTPVTVSVAELAATLGYTRCHTWRAIGQLTPRYLQVTRKGPRSRPTFLLGAARMSRDTNTPRWPDLQRGA